MQDDFRPTQAPAARAATLQMPLAPTTPAQPAPVDELKITEEFGPVPDENPSINHSATGLRGTMMKLLPALTTRHHSHRLASILLLAAGIVLVVASGAGAYWVRQYYHPFSVGAYVTHWPKPKPKVIPSLLSGLLVDPSVNNRQVTAVMIENSIDARPQSGLDEAGVVFEALAEGGVTRFMALFQDSQPNYIGPVRSARPYYIQWLLGFDAAYAHVGGSPDALGDITAWGVKDLNQFYNASAYHRIASRYAPHNVYTSVAELNQLETSKGYTKSTFTGFKRKTKEEPSKAPTATKIDITFSGYYYDSHYDYDPGTNTYKRSESGAPHMELHGDGKQVQIAPKVVVAMIVPRQNGVLDASGAYYSDYAAIGTGPITVFQDGLFQDGTWSKASNTAPLIFNDASGKPLALNPGQTWIAATPLASNVTHK